MAVKSYAKKVTSYSIKLQHNVYFTVKATSHFFAFFTELIWSMRDWSQSEGNQGRMMAFLSGGRMRVCDALTTHVEVFFCYWKWDEVQGRMCKKWKIWVDRDGMWSRNPNTIKNSVRFVPTTNFPWMLHCVFLTEQFWHGKWPII